MGIEIPSWLDAGAGSATCNLLTAGASVAIGVAVNSLRTGAVWPGIGAAAVGAGFYGAAHALNCTYNPGAPPPSSGIGGELCPTGTNNKTNIENLGASGWVSTQITGQPVKAITSVVKDTSGTVGYRAKYTRWDMAGEFDAGKYSGSSFRTVVVSCGLPVTPAPAATIKDYDYTYTTTDGCQFVYSFKDAWIGPDGMPQIAWEVNGKSPAAFATCQGGRIAGYVWSPNAQNRYVYNPEFNFGAGGVGGGLGGAWPNIAGALVGRLVSEILELKWPQATFRLASACELDENGNPIDKSYEVQIPAGAALPAILNRLDAIGKWTDSATAPHGGTSMLQSLKDFRQPVCSKRKATGDLVTVNFDSLLPSPAGERPLRKLLRYRDQTGADVCNHANHWDGFEWDAGPVCVISKGLRWGEPQVWAASAAEGRRVIAHAAAIAGVDLSDPKHRWTVTHSKDPRYGQAGRMVTKMLEWHTISVSKRPGPSATPVYPVAQ